MLFHNTKTLNCVETCPIDLIEDKTNKQCTEKC